MKIVCIISLLSILCGCSSLKFPFVYQVVVQQGNYVEQEMIDKLEVGMTRRQVKFVMGSPLMEDTFNPDRWDYFYQVKRGEKEFTKKRFTVYFEKDTLARWDGDLKQIAVNADGSEDNAKEVRPEDEDYMKEGTGDSGD